MDPITERNTIDNLLDYLYDNVPITICYIKYSKSPSEVNLFAIVPYSCIVGQPLIDDIDCSYNPLCFIWCPTNKQGFVSPREFFDIYYERADYYYFFAPLKGERKYCQSINLDQIKQSIKNGGIQKIDMRLIKIHKKTKKMYISSQNFYPDKTDDGNRVEISNMIDHVINNDKIRCQNFEFFPYLLIKDSISHLR